MSRGKPMNDFGECMAMALLLLAFIAVMGWAL